MEKHQSFTHDDHHGFPWKHIIGFILSLVLTFAALFIVLSGALPTTMTLTAIVVLAIFQVLVQLLMFMHLNEHEGVFQTISMAFGFLIALAVVAGSIWVMSFGM